MSMKKANGRGMALGMVVSLIGMAVGFAGCGGTEVGSPPVIDDTSLLVSCTATTNDSGAADFVWDFVAGVDDPDGYDDVVDVYVNVIHPDMGDTPMGTLDLESGGNGEWSLQIYQSEASFLDCDNAAAYDFDFYAYDASGQSDAVTTGAI